MKRMLIAMAVLAVTALPSFAADAPTADMTGNSPDMGGMRRMMQQHPGMKKEMMRNPQHLLMMAYHRNLINFGRTLEKTARQGELVQREVARTAIAEMRRSVDEMEKYRAGAMATMPADMKPGEMHKMMDQHLVTVKTQLRELEDLTKSDRIKSQDVIKHLQPILAGCEEMDCGMGGGRGMYGRGMYGKRGMRGCGCQQAMPEHHEMMEGILQKMKGQDAELGKQVEQMTRAPRDQKVDLMADIVAKLVQQRAAMTANMEKMQKHMHGDGASMPLPACMNGVNDEDTDEDADTDSMDDTDNDDMNMQDMNMHDMDK